jgi:hypothetical protein
MSEAAKAESKAERGGHESTATGKPVIHRVCIQCNGMFKVTADNYAAKQCPNCHKG